MTLRLWTNWTFWFWKSSHNLTRNLSLISSFCILFLLLRNLNLWDTPHKKQYIQSNWNLDMRFWCNWSIKTHEVLKGENLDLGPSNHMSFLGPSNHMRWWKMDKIWLGPSNHMSAKIWSIWGNFCLVLPKLRETNRIHNTTNHNHISLSFCKDNYNHNSISLFFCKKDMIPIVAYSSIF